ncbi:MAG: hypothetical protein ABSF29_14640 [Tepidisphaeraceae bacterium]
MISSDPQIHRRLEQQFILRAQQLLDDPRLRIDTVEGRRALTDFQRDITTGDHGVELKLLMSKLEKPDRELELKMPIGRRLDVVLSEKKKFWSAKATMGRLRVACLSPTAALIEGKPPEAATVEDVTAALAELPPPLPGANPVPTTVVLMSTGGFTADATETMERGEERTVILIWPNRSGGWTAAGPPQTQFIADLFDPEAPADKKKRINTAIEAGKSELLTGSLSAEHVAEYTDLPMRMVEAEMKNYASEHTGLVAKRIRGQMVMYRAGESPPVGLLLRGGANMPVMDRFFLSRLKSVFSKKGDLDKKIALLSERRASLTQLRDRGYEDLSVLERKEDELRRQFKEAGETPRRRITSQLLQLRKDVARRQQLLSVLNQQVNVINTHLHSLELQKHGEYAQLPTPEEIAADASKAEEILAQLEADSELAQSVTAGVNNSLWSEEQALYEELVGEEKAPAKSEEEEPEMTQLPESPPDEPILHRKTPVRPHPAEPEVG